MSILALILLGMLLRQDQYVAGDQHLRRRGMATPGFDQETNVNIAFESRIIGGTITSGTKYPFHVNLDVCGGSLVAKDVVLTAAHCYEADPNYVLIGGSTRFSGERIFVSGQGLVDPGYRAQTQVNDFLLYKLRSASTSTPVPINFDDSKPSDGETLTVIGFGTTVEGGNGSNNLREVNVKYVPSSTCNVNYEGSVEDDIMFCAGTDGGGHDSCQGDSGGPIIDQNGVLVGVTSWGNGCGLNGFPGVYARVSGAKDWLKQNICDLSDFPPDFCGDSAGGGNSNVVPAANNVEQGPAAKPTGAPTQEPTNSGGGNGNGFDQAGSNADAGPTSAPTGEPTISESDNGSYTNDDGTLNATDSYGNETETADDFVVVDQDTNGDDSVNMDMDDNFNDNSSGNATGANDYVQPKDVNLKIKLHTDDYPEESALILYQVETNRALLWQDYGTITTPGTFTKTITDLTQGKYVFLIYDEYRDGICCQYGRGSIELYETFPPELGIADQLIWSSNGRFRKKAGASFCITDATTSIQRSGLQTGSRIEFDDSFDPKDDEWRI